MPGNAVIYNTSSIVDTTPDRAAVSSIATIGNVAAGINGNNVRLLATLTFAPGADTTDVRLQWYRNAIAAGVTVGSIFTVSQVTAATAAPLVCMASENAPNGVHTYTLGITQTAASADGVVGALFAVAIVGN